MRFAIPVILLAACAADERGSTQPFDQCGGTYFDVLSPGPGSRVDGSLDVHLSIELQDVLGYEAATMTDDLGARYEPVSETREPGAPAYLTDIVRHYELAPGRRLTLVESWCGCRPDCDEHTVAFDTLP